MRGRSRRILESERMTQSIWARVLAVTSLLWATALIAQDGESAPATCESDPRYAEFDFWLGHWDVFVDGKKAGTNTITREEGGCLVLEKWTDVAGGTGQSYNFFNPDTEQWRQVWVSRNITIDYTGGLTDDGSMELTGKITYFQNGKSLEFMGRWTPQDDGTVRQYFEQYDEDAGAMVPVFTGIYHRSGQDTVASPDR
jgi:hypothetical protein